MERPLEKSYNSEKNIHYQSDWVLPTVWSRLLNSPVPALLFHIYSTCISGQRGELKAKDARIHLVGEGEHMVVDGSVI